MRTAAGRRPAASHGAGTATASPIRRIALLTRPIIRLERIVRSSIRAILAIAPLNMCIPIRAVFWRRCGLVCDDPADDGTKSERRQGIPHAVGMSAIAGAAVLLAAMAIPMASPVVVVLVVFAAVLLPAPLVPMLRLHHICGRLRDTGDEDWCS